MVNVKKEEGCSEPEVLLPKKTMYRPYKPFRRGSRRNNRGFKYYRPRYACQDCRIACTSSKQLEQHLSGIKHKNTVSESSKEENTFPLEHMVVLDETEDDLPNDNGASPASCDSSDSETAACASDFQIDGIPSSHMVIIDETNDDNDNPASPASCDSSASEFAPSISDKTRIQKPEDDQTASQSLPWILSSCPSSSYVPDVRAGTSEKSTSKEHHAKSSKTRHEESKKTFYLEPIKSSQDVFQFLKTFAIANDSDVAFANKVKEMFSNALRKYKEVQLEEIICTEEEHSLPEEPEGLVDDCNDREQGNSIPQVPIKTNSAPSSPNNSSSAQCISIPMSSADSKEDSPILIQSDNPDTLSIASQSPTNNCENKDTSNNQSTTNSTNDNSCSAIEADLLMESEDCVTAEAACSDDDDDDV